MLGNDSEGKQPGATTASNTIFYEGCDGSHHTSTLPMVGHGTHDDSDSDTDTDTDTTINNNSSSSAPLIILLGPVPDHAGSSVVQREEVVSTSDNQCVVQRMELHGHDTRAGPRQAVVHLHSTTHQRKHMTP